MTTHAGCVDADALVKGTVIRITTATLKSKITVRLDDQADIHLTEKGNSYVVMTGYRVRPDDHNISFGKRQFYMVAADRVEILKKG